MFPTVGPFSLAVCTTFEPFEWERWKRQGVSRTMTALCVGKENDKRPSC